MVLEDIAANVSRIVINNELLSRAGNLITLFQAIGGLIIAYLIFNIISLWLGRKKAKEISKMSETLERIDKRLQRFEKRNK